MPWWSQIYEAWHATLVVFLNSDLDEEGGEDMRVEIEARQYILHRFKTMSYYSNCVPYEYAPHLIKSDMEKAGFQPAPDESEIEEVISEAKLSARDKIITMLRESRSLSEIREWCEFALQCPVPIPSVSSVSMNQLLMRYDYFNYELNRIVREEQISASIRERKEKGIMFDSAKLIRELERNGIHDMSDEFTKLETMKSDEINEVIRDAEENSENAILNYVVEGHSRDEITRMAEADDDIAFSAEEVPQVIEGITRKERFSIITREVARMDTSEMWNLINNIESYRMWRLSAKGNGGISSVLEESQMQEMLKLYEQSRDSLKEGYLFQVSKLGNTDLSLLVRLIQGYISWRGAFYYMPQNNTLLDERDLSKSILEGFSHEHGMDPEIFRMFLIRSR